MTRDITIMEVSRKEFEKKMKDLHPKTKGQIANAMRSGKEIKCFQYGRIPGIRIYKIVYKDGMTRTWKTFKM